MIAIARRSIPLLPCLLATLLLAACDAAGAADGDTLDDFPRLVAREELRIGDRDDPTLGFSFIQHVEVDGRGEVYVVDALAREIRVFDGSGRFLRRFGRQGEGPGEFSGFLGFGLMGDTVWVSDLSNRRVTLLDRQGSVLSTGQIETARIALPPQFGHFYPMVQRPDRTLLGYMASIGTRHDDPPAGPSLKEPVPLPFVRFALNGEVIDTIGWAPRPPPRMWRPPSEEQDQDAYRSIEVGGRRYTRPTPPTTLPWWELLPDGFVTVATPVADSPERGEIRVTRLTIAQDTVYDRRLSYTPRGYSAAELDTIASRGSQGLAGMVVSGRPPTPPDPQVAARIRAEMDFPAFQLPIDFLWVAQDEGLWLRRYAAYGPTAQWLLLDPRATPRGEVELPAKSRILWSEGDTFWASVPDEMDVPWLVRYRLVPAS